MNAPRHPHIDLINGIGCLLADNVTCAKTWGFYLMSDEFADEPELRNKCGVLWLVALLDSVEGESRVLSRYEAEAETLHLSHLLAVCAQVRVFIHQVSDLLRMYTREEQLFLSALRDQWVHGWLDKRHRKEFKAKYFDGQKVVSELFRAEDYHSLIRPYFEYPGGLDECLQPLLGRAVRNELPYWQSVHAVKGRIDEIIGGMTEGRSLQIPELRV